MRNLGIAAICAALGGCVAQAETAVDDPVVWGRVDCVRAQDDPMAGNMFEQAKAICTNRAQAAGLVTAASMPSGGRTLGDALANGIIAGATSASVSNATANSCMAENGYIQRPRSGHEEACAPIYAQRDRVVADAAAQRKRMVVRSARAAPKPDVSKEPAQAAPLQPKTGT